MIIHGVTAHTAPVAYAGGIASSSRPGFGAALQASLAALQATRSGTATLLQEHGPAHHPPTGPAQHHNAHHGAHLPLG